MKRTTLTRFFNRLPLWLATALTPMGLWAQSLCPRENATLNGAYVTRATGSVGGAPLAVVGITTYDGRGGFQLSATISFNGAINKGAGSGTYTVNRDCTGSQTFGSGPGAAHYDLVVTPDGRKITYIQTDTGTVVTVTSVRLSRRQDD